MRVITTHIGADFDSLASMVAASKLYGGGVLCFSGSAGRNVREFLMKNAGRWEVLTPRQVEFDSITSLVVVDARSPNRIGQFAKLLEKPGITVHVYDHHPPVIDDIPSDFSLIEPLGAATTLMVERLLSEKISISPHEATLFAMGIYEDTGALTFGSTTSRDIQAVIALKEMGADLTSIPFYIELSLDPVERRIQDKLIENAREKLINGARVVLSTLTFEQYVEGLSLFVHRLRDYFEADVAIAAVKMGKHVYVVARSREEVMDVARFLAPLGGGGHPQAASLTLAEGNPEKIINDLEKMLERAIEPSVTIGDIMTSPVMAVDPLILIEDAYKVMIRYGHAALPVADNGKLKGIITRKDLDKATIHGLGKAPVKDFMTERPVSISPAVSVAEAHRIMVMRNIGRLPVLENDVLVGIVTRTDILRALYPRSLPSEKRPLAEEMPWTENVSDIMARRLKPWVLGLLAKLGRRAEEMGLKAFIVGGFVRDLLLGRENEDLDIVVEGDALEFIRSWEKDGCRVATHKKFRTGTIVFPSGKKVDVATARREFYEYPVAQPSVSSDSLKHDLYRRDYTVNAMAVSINRSTWGTLVDYFGGRQDLKKKVLRVLHNLSFVEDPTRVIRGIRLEQRLEFDIEENTYRLMINCIKGGLVSLLSGVRLRSELELIFKEGSPYKMVKRCAQLGLWRTLFPGLNPGKETIKIMRRISFFRRRLSRDLPDMTETEWLPYLSALVSESHREGMLSVLDRLHVSDKERSIVVESIDEMGSAEHILGGRGEKPNSRIYEYLSKIHPAVALYWAAATNRWRVRRRILLYLTRLRKIEPMLIGRDMLDMGYKEGPMIGYILKALRNARLDGLVETREEEIEWVLKNFPKKDRK
ncbi:CBS domain-containing protein [Thermovirga sp.]|uniref:CBS domain-containing protein n=1 Tax=Thermovirga sp. TaxID=2699834 RepID=UPI0025CC8F1B|nr:CBS domain-containing protein [Thermovirga sp.]MBO8153291.1 CBS domain-containing protein [Thermovirga sp.]